MLGAQGKSVILLCGAAALTASIVGSLSAVRTPTPVPLPIAGGSSSVGPYMEVLEDPSGALRLEDVLSPTYAAEFRPTGRATPNYGYTASAYWFRFSLPGAEARNKELWLEIRFPSLDRVDLFVPWGDGRSPEGYQRLTAGDLLPWSTRPLRYRSYVFPLAAPTIAGAHEHYLRVTAGSVLTVPAYLWEPQAFAARDHDDQIVRGIFYGLVIALAIYNLMLFFAVRDRAYLLYVLYVSFFGLSLFTFDGLAFEYLWPESVWWANHGIALTLALALAFGTWFALAFLDVTRYAPRLAYVLRAIAWTAAGLGACAASGWFLSVASILRVVSVLAIAFAAMATFVAFKALMSGYRPARFFLLAFSAVLAFVAIGALRNFAIVPTNAVTLYGLHFGLALDVILLSFALADRINELRRERAQDTARLNRLKRFVSPRIGEMIVAGEVDDPLKTHRRDITVVFTDLRGFTSFAETAEPEEVMKVLRTYHGTLGSIVAAHEGTIEHFAGDGVMILFNDPVPIVHHELMAVRMALEMRAAVETLENEWRRIGYELGFGVGIANGFATMGAIGFEGRLDYGAIGSVTNLAARLCGEAKAGQVLISQRVHAAVEGEIQAVYVGELRLKGFHRPVAVYSAKSLARTEVRGQGSYAGTSISSA